MIMEHISCMVQKWGDKEKSLFSYDIYDITEARTIIKYIAEKNKPSFDGKKKTKFADISASFDIESTSFTKALIKRLAKRDVQLAEKVALMYVWQFGITDDSTGYTYVITGRTWSEFRELLKIIREEYMKEKGKGKKTKYLFPIFVHNFAFEFGFMAREFCFSEVFAVKSASPLYARLYDCFEFRCSYLLSGVGLKDLHTKGFKKIKDGLNYDLPRHEKTPLTAEEKAYCVADVVTLCEYISIMREQDGCVGKMQYTKTGYARKYMKEKTMGTEFMSTKRRDYIQENLIPLAFHSAGEMVVQTMAYQGGHTASCPFYTRKTLGKNGMRIRCYDITSSYPTVMVCENRFPIALLKTREKMKENEWCCEMAHGHAIVAKVKFKNLRSKYNFDAWIPAAHVVGWTDKGSDLKERCVVENGKVISCEGEMEMFVTDVDYEIYEMFYEWDEFEAEAVHVYKTGYLPKSVIECVLDLYKDKTELKDLVVYNKDGSINEEATEAAELEYSIKKSLLNSLYGMAVMSPCRGSVDYFGGEWHTKKPEKIEEYEQARLEYNKNLAKGKIALPYITGVFISALSRKNLALAVYQAGMKGVWVYSDTDSFYCLDGERTMSEWISLYNQHIKSKMEAMCKFYSLPEDIWRPKNVEKKEKPLGYWDCDGDFDYFKTLGAKRYIKYNAKKGLQTTVAGLGKKEGATYLLKKYGGVLEAMDAFDDQLTIPAEETGKLTHTTIKDEIEGDLTDYLGNTFHYVAKGGIHLGPASFCLSMVDVYLKFLLNIQEGESRAN